MGVAVKLELSIMGSATAPCISAFSLIMDGWQPLRSGIVAFERHQNRA